MSNALTLRKAMSPGKVYRRQELKGFTTAVDRDLKALVKNGAVKKLHAGLYCLPSKSPLGLKPPSNEEIVRAFLKTDDFLVTSYNHFNRLGLGLTQLYNNHVVYNHKRSGNFVLGGRQFKFRMVPAFPTRLSKEFLLVDLLNNLASLPDNTELVYRHLKKELAEYDRGAFRECLEKYGRPPARKAIEAINAKIFA